MDSLRKSLGFRELLVSCDVWSTMPAEQNMPVAYKRVSLMVVPLTRGGLRTLTFRCSRCRGCPAPRTCRPPRAPAASRSCSCCRGGTPLLPEFHRRRRCCRRCCSCDGRCRRLYVCVPCRTASGRNKPEIIGVRQARKGGHRSRYQTTSTPVSAD